MSALKLSSLLRQNMHLSLSRFSSSHNPCIIVARACSSGSKSSSEFKSIKYWVKDRVAHIQLHRPERLNAIDTYMPAELEQAVDMANFDEEVKVL